MLAGKDDENNVHDKDDIKPPIRHGFVLLHKLCVYIQFFTATKSPDGLRPQIPATKIDHIQ